MKNKKLLILIASLLFTLHPGLAQENGTARINQTLQRELLRMEKSDQMYREQASALLKKSSYKQTTKRIEALDKKQEQIDKKNIKRLEVIIEKYGWPGRSLVGSDGSLAAFLIVQHAELKYQKKYFPLIKEAVSKNEAEPMFAAYLEDRILTLEGKRQIYGTQLHTNEVTKELELMSIEDEENVDTRRASVGLGSLAEYLKQFGLEYKPPKKK